MQTSDHMRFRVLSESQIEKIHFATLEVLERTGVRILHKEALKLLKDAGCLIKKNNIVKIHKGYMPRRELEANVKNLTKK